MDSPPATHLELVLDAALAVLAPASDRDWRVPARDLEWSCWEAAAHVAHDLLAYAAQLSARATGAYLPLDLVVRPGTPVPGVLEVVRASGALLATALRAAGPDARAWHWGLTDRTAFAALGTTELLVHTWDVAQGLGLGWQPPDDLAAPAVQRLFSGAAQGVPPSPPGQLLLWCTGRTALPGHPRQREWTLSPRPSGLAGADW